MSTAFVNPKQDFPFFYVNYADETFEKKFGFVYRPFTTWDNYDGASSFAGPGKGRLILEVSDEITARYENETVIKGVLTLEDGSRASKDVPLKRGNNYYFKKL